MKLEKIFNLNFISKLIPVLLKFFKSAAVLKLGLLGASLATYSYIFTWQFALIIIFSLFVHEYGHIWAMKRYGMQVRGIYMVPLLGATVISEEDFPSRKAEVVVAIMGPVWGLVLAGLTGLLYYSTHNPFFAATASWMAMLNIFNLLPINPLDGGRIIKSVAFSIHSRLGILFLVLGSVVVACVAVWLKFFLFFGLLIAGLMGLYDEWKLRSKESVMSSRESLLSVFSYVVVLGLLWIIMETFKHLPGAELALRLLQD